MQEIAERLKQDVENSPLPNLLASNLYNVELTIPAPGTEWTFRLDLALCRKTAS